MKATAIILAMVLFGLMLQMNGYETLGSEIYDGFSDLWDGSGLGRFVVIGSSVALSFGLILLGKDLPWYGLAALLLSVATAPIGVFSAANFPWFVKIPVGAVWGLATLQSIGLMLGGEI